MAQPGKRSEKCEISCTRDIFPTRLQKMLFLVFAKQAALRSVLVEFLVEFLIELDDGCRCPLLVVLSGGRRVSGGVGETIGHTLMC